MTTAAIGNDGAFIDDGCQVLNYALNTIDEYGAPTVIVPTEIDGEAMCFVSGYRPLDKEAEEAIALAWDDDAAVRSAVLVGFCIQAYDDANEAPRYRGLLGGEL